jgi:DNA-binding cell septation regulator SpoVG
VAEVGSVYTLEEEPNAVNVDYLHYVFTGRESKIVLTVEEEVSSVRMESVRTNAGRDAEGALFAFTENVRAVVKRRVVEGQGALFAFTENVRAVVKRRVVEGQGALFVNMGNARAAAMNAVVKTTASTVEKRDNVCRVGG